MAELNKHSQDSSQMAEGIPAENQDSYIDLRDFVRRAACGLPQIVGLGLIGLVSAGLLFFLIRPLLPYSASSRIVFSFQGFDRGEYPDHSKFSADDLRAPDIVGTAIKGLSLPGGDELQTMVRGGLSIEGVVPTEVTKQRDRLRAAGQIPPPYFPDEYTVRLTLPRSISLTSSQSKALLGEIVSVYRDKFRRTYVDSPATFGNAFDALPHSDYFEYELILNREIETIVENLTLDRADAKTFRSPTTNLSFDDLLTKTQLFAQIQLNETLGLILQNGLSRDRSTAMVKMDYYLGNLADQENKAIEEESVVQSLLSEANQHAQGYVLGIKSELGQSRTDSPIIDQGLVDSLIANDSYNFLVRQALEAGLKVKRIHAERMQLQERRKAMEAFIKSDAKDQTVVVAQVERSLAALQVNYNMLIEDIRKTHEDYARQHFADAIRFSDGIITDNPYRLLLIATSIGLALGVALGLGLSLLEIYAGKSGPRQPTPTRK
jgi:ElaB/YqjD/DUF883 family membrane-anchored ribosome-binding protein